ncbi:Uncharacterised protein [Mycobacterium tuberculosis]|nr:Uncharacterised protein [Mycobacterium tuberculosis]
MGFVEFLHQFEVRLHDWHQHQLGNTFANGDVERGLATVPARHHQLALVVRIDQAHQVTQHDAVFVAQARARQDQSRQARIADVDRQAGGDQDGLTRLKDGVLLKHGAQVQAG